MRNSLRAPSIGVLALVLSLGSALAAAPASALSSNAASARSENAHQISWQDSSIDVSSLLSSSDLAKFLGSSNAAPGAADVLAKIFGRLETKFGPLWSQWHKGTTTTSPTPAIPEPTAALAFGLGLVIATRRRR